MKKKNLLLSAAACGLLAPAFGASPLKVTADRLAADRNSEALVASGHVVAVSAPYRLHTDYLERDAEGRCRFSDPTMATTCTNLIGHLHWRVTGEVEYQSERYVRLRNMYLHFFGVPVFWLPYFYYPLDMANYGFRWMPGYTGRWGAYLLTQYRYHLLGDGSGAEGTWSLDASSGIDLRTKQGIAYSQDFKWRLGDFGVGRFNLYYAWDQDAGRYNRPYGSNDYNLNHWGSSVPDNRYGMTLEHRWEATERDTVRLRGELYSDSFFRHDFLRKTMFSPRRQWIGYEGNEIAWEHRENPLALGVSVSGPIDDFAGGTMRLPEIYFDVNPLPVWSLPVNYETENRLGYLKRQPAEYGQGGEITPYSHRPGVWAEYDTFRFDTYHRLTAPFKVADAVSVVPRIGYHGTFWQDAGLTTLDSYRRLGDADESMTRSILEAGVTFAGRGVAQLNDSWRHFVEPYLDVLAQKAYFTGDGHGARPYVFDAIDASMDWSDQFAGRSRNLPYTYAGFTPGVRNAFQKVDEKGVARTVLDFDVYAAVQVNEAKYEGTDPLHRLAETGDPNYGDNQAVIMPGFRARYFPTKDTMLLTRFEYDSDSGEVALFDLSWKQRLAKDFSYYVTMNHRNHRYWDFAASPYDPEVMQSDEFNCAHFSFITVGFEHELCDAIVWSPYVRWDGREGELDSAGAWLDLRTDCLGFRFLVDYENEFTRIDGYREDEDWNFGFYIYLRCFGADSGNVFGGR